MVEHNGEVITDPAVVARMRDFMREDDEQEETNRRRRNEEFEQLKDSIVNRFHPDTVFRGGQVLAGVRC